MDLPTGAVLHTSRLRESITALAWSAPRTLFAGGSGGGVAVLDVKEDRRANGDSALPVAEHQGNGGSVAAPRQILALDSRVIQLQAAGDILGRLCM